MSPAHLLVADIWATRRTEVLVNPLKGPTSLKHFSYDRGRIVMPQQVADIAELYRPAFSRQALDNHSPNFSDNFRSCCNIGFRVAFSRRRVTMSE